ncbi:tumor protein D53 isoform X2 [Triplophysa rosa]|uniref:tumor protein D53 isoform X2 n=1 Tax=Triplophysa rosa TaxID=992332 RepID=UPI002545DAD1|nr:tumor protein D53 isoform X2 [Triplophysa rosa]
MEPRQQELYSSVLTPETADWDERGALHAGLLDKEALKEVDEDMVSEVDLNNMITDEEREEMLNELTKLEEEIATLKQVLDSKEKRHLDLKEKLGITPLGELRHNFSKNWNDMQSSTAYKKTSETLSTAGQKTSVAFSNLGTAISRKFGDMSMFGLQILYPRRNSPSFKSFEEKVETTVSNIKSKVGGTGGAGSFEEVLSSAAHASAQNTPTNNVTESSENTC